MQINQHSKISELIKFNALSIDAIAAISKPLRKIRIPVLRRILTPRISIAEAARIGGCSVEDFRIALEPLGFIWLSAVTDNGINADQDQQRPAWMDDGEVTVLLDVRPLLDKGQDPLREIVQLYGLLPERGILCISNSFVPIPLIRRMEERGARSFYEKWAEGEFRSYFYKSAGRVSVKGRKGANTSFMSDAEMESMRSRLDTNQVISVDVTTLPMPQPMEVILDTVARLKSQEVMDVRHRQVPLHLLEELGTSRFVIYINERAPGDVRLLIYPQK